MTLKKYIPDALTCCNLLCGSAGVVFALDGRADIAFFLMLAAACFDFLDGFAARMLDAYSALGKELDSLSDVVSFGVLPSVMLVNLMRVCSFSNGLLCLVPLLIAVFSGLRLAKFNIDERQHDSFIGLPTPASALLCGSLAYYIAVRPASLPGIWAAGPVFIPLLAVALCALLVSGIPMFSLKFGKSVHADGALRVKRLAMGLVAAVVVLLVVFFRQDWSLAVLLIMSLYIIKNCIYAIFKI